MFAFLSFSRLFSLALGCFRFGGEWDGGGMDLGMAQGRVMMGFYE